MKTTAMMSSLSDSPQIGYTPKQIKKAYNLKGPGEGKGMTVSIIDFIGNPYIQQNLDVFSTEFELPKTTIREYGKASAEAFDFGAYIEPCADSQWVHAISPYAQINIIKANSFSVEGAMRAVKDALEIGTHIMLMTFQSEFVSEYIMYNDILSNNCVFIASAGDYGAQTNFPACFPECISVGGTRLEISRQGERISDETVWRGTGGGICSYFEIPDYQNKMYGISELTDGKRGVPDVSHIADPDTGVAVYHSSTTDRFGWYKTGGTSISASIVAGIMANVLSQNNSNNISLKNIINDLYNLAGGTSYTNPYRKFKDVTVGSNGTHSAKVGYDLCTGLGSLINI